MERMIQVSVHQLKPVPADLHANIDCVLHHMQTASGEGADLAVFPECMLTGYVFDSREEAMNAAVPADAVIERLAPACRGLGLSMCVGFLERDNARVYNTAALITPDGASHLYRKTHLPPLGADRFIDAGDGPLTVVQTALGCIGVMICYDMRFPEVALTLALQGAELLLLPTNWPDIMTANPDFTTRCRARDTEAYLLACDRWGVENGTQFLGRSQIIDPSGQVIAEAPVIGDAALHAELDMSNARRYARAGHGPLVDRRPELYRI